MRILLIICVLFTFIVSINAEWIKLDESNQSNVLEINEIEGSNQKITFHLDGYFMENVDLDNMIYKKIVYNDEDSYQISGKPELPHFSRIIAIPQDSEVEYTVEVHKSEEINDVRIAPYQEESIASFQLDRSVYNQKTCFPEKTVQVSDSANLRDFHVVNLTINPFQYNPSNHSMQIHTDITVTLHFSRNQQNYLSSNRKLSRSFVPLYRSVIANYDTIADRDREYQAPSYLFISPNNDLVESTLETLIEWRQQKGYEVSAVNTSETGNSLNSIKNFIQDAYDNWENPPEYVCLVGDADGSIMIPTGYEDGGEGDHYYTLLSGNDILADVFIGRLSIDSNSDLQTIISKIINYEKNPYMGNPDWFEKVLLVGDPSSSGSSTIITSKYIKELIELNQPQFSFLEEYNGSYVNAIEDGYNEGVSYFNYRGFIGMSGWENSHTTSLNNGFMLPVTMILTCATGGFSSSYNEARSEIFLRAGTPSVPKGAIAAVGTATSQTHTCYNNLVSSGTFYGIFNDKIGTMGAALTRGKLALFRNYPDNDDNAVNKFSYWNNLMGDPALEVWSAKPKSLNLSFEDEVATGTNYIEVLVEDDNGSSVTDVWITALKEDEIFVSAYSDENGYVYLPVNSGSEGDITITATKHDYIPEIDECEISAFDYAVQSDHYIIDDDNSDDSIGNDNEILNPNEHIEFKPRLKNTGTNAVSSLSVTLSTENEFITITDAEETYSAIPSGSSVYPNEDFDFIVAANTPNNLQVVFHLSITDGTQSWNDIIILTCQAPEFYTDSYEIIDDNDGIAQPGESVDLSITLQNIGFENITQLYGTLTCENNFIEVQDDSGFFGNINVGDSGNNDANPFTIEINPIVLPGTSFILSLDLYSASGFEQSIPVIVDIGNPSLSDPSGPDAYGYFAYDDEDTDYIDTPVYNWIEIDPDHGGNGTILSMNDSGNNGDLEDVDLPFVFNFYGQSYEMITICTNGFIVPGGTEQFSFMNREIPGPLGPSPMIAPFWDDLITGSGNVCYFYDAAQHIFIVEWSHLSNEYNNAEETFQVLLYDPAYYPTSTGDGKIVFQYETINNVDQGEYGGYHEEHGLYATIGIQDHTETVGLQYSFNNDFPTTAKPLENEMAIAFVGAPIPFEEVYLTLGELNVIDENGNNLLDSGETAELDIYINNIGESTATNVSATISTDDPYVTITQGNSEYGTIDGESSIRNITRYQVSVEENVPNGHIAPISVDITSDQGVWNLILNVPIQAPEFLFNKTFINDNEDYMLDPGESVDLYVLIDNIGGTPLQNVEAVLSCNDNDVNITQDTSESVIFEGNSSESFMFSLSIDDDINIGSTLSFIVDLSAEGFSSEIEFNLSVGVAVENFESGTFDYYPWEFSGSGGPWQISTTSYEGNYSAQSPDINDNDITALEITVDFATSGEISFWKKVSTENWYDYFTFYVDGSPYGEWSGEESWSQETYNISAGTHILKWEYEKDFTVSSGSDCVWLDYILFPMGGEVSDAELEFSNDSINIEMSMLEELTESFTITNIGTIVSHYDVSLDDEYEWVYVSPENGYVIEEETDEIYLNLNATNLTTGNYECTIVVSDNRNETTIPLYLYVNDTESDSNEIPQVTTLNNNYPNPFNPSTTLTFSIPKSDHTKLIIYNSKGQKVKTLLNDFTPAGYRQLEWFGKDDNDKAVSSGIYFYQLQTSDFIKTKKMMLIK